MLQQGCHQRLFRTGTSSAGGALVAQNLVEMPQNRLPLLGLWDEGHVIDEHFPHSTVLFSLHTLCSEIIRLYRDCGSTEIALSSSYIYLQSIKVRL